MRRQRAALERRDTLLVAMKNIILSITIGIDLGDKKYAICALNAEGEIIDERIIAGVSPRITTNKLTRWWKWQKSWHGTVVEIPVFGSGVSRHGPWRWRENGV